MSKYDRNNRDVYVVKRLGDEIGYGHLMSLAHELWARHLEEKGLPREGAFCAVGYSRIKDEYQADAMNDPIYKVIVDRALSDTPQTDCETCKYDVSEDDYDLYDMCEPMVEGECRYEPMDESQTDCGWGKPNE